MMGLDFTFLGSLFHFPFTFFFPRNFSTAFSTSKSTSGELTAGPLMATCKIQSSMSIFEELRSLVFYTLDSTNLSLRPGFGHWSCQNYLCYVAEDFNTIQYYWGELLTESKRFKPQTVVCNWVKVLSIEGCNSL